MATSSFLPQLATVLRNGYGLRAFRADLAAGLTVAVVALPLSLAIAIASGVGPDRGLTTAIVGGFFASALGGARHQIGGPAGAFIVLVSACVAAIGVDGLILATFLSGMLTLLAGLARIGGLVRYIPHPVVLGFGGGVGVIILISQMQDLLGLPPAAAGHDGLSGRIVALWAAREAAQPASVLAAGATVVLILALRRWRPHWPGLLIAVALVTLAVAGLGLPVATVASRFGALPHGLPLPGLPEISAGAVWAALPWAASFSLLGALETLLSAVVADAMTGDRHRPGAEMVAQGVANIGSALFGGFCVTGLIARTVINVRAGAHGPVAGMLHAVFLLGFMLVAAPLIGLTPLAALAGVLVVVAFGMFDLPEARRLWRLAPPEGLVAIVTLALVVGQDLTVAILAGCLLAAGLTLKWLFRQTGLHQAPDGTVHLRGPYHFAAAARQGDRLEGLARAGAVRLDMAAVPMIDSTGARSLDLLAGSTHRQGGTLQIVAARPEVLRRLDVQGLPGASGPDQANGSAG